MRLKTASALVLSLVISCPTRPARAALPDGLDVIEDTETRALMAHYREAVLGRQGQDALASLSLLVSRWREMQSPELEKLGRQMARILDVRARIQWMLNPIVILVDEMPRWVSQSWSEVPACVPPGVREELRQKVLLTSQDEALWKVSIVRLRETGFYLDLGDGTLSLATRLCKQHSPDLVTCRDVLEDLRAYFDSRLQGLDSCRAATSMRTRFLCTEGVICDPSQLLAGADPEALGRLGIDPCQRLQPTVTKTILDEAGRPGTRLLDRAQPVAQTTAGAMADALCQELYGGKLPEPACKKPSGSAGTSGSTGAAGSGGGGWDPIGVFLAQREGKGSCDALPDGSQILTAAEGDLRVSRHAFASCFSSQASGQSKGRKLKVDCKLSEGAAGSGKTTLKYDPDKREITVKLPDGTQLKANAQDGSATIPLPGGANVTVKVATNGTLTISGSKGVSVGALTGSVNTGFSVQIAPNQANYTMGHVSWWARITASVFGQQVGSVGTSGAGDFGVRNFMDAMKQNDEASELYTTPEGQNPGPEGQGCMSEAALRTISRMTCMVHVFRGLTPSEVAIDPNKPRSRDVSPLVNPGDQAATGAAACLKIAGQVASLKDFCVLEDPRARPTDEQVCGAMLTPRRDPAPIDPPEDFPGPTFVRFPTGATVPVAPRGPSGNPIDPLHP